jgi:hypothetical protein
MTPRRRQALIAFKTRMAERWQADRPGMLRRSRAGAKATASKAEQVRNSVHDWLATKGTWFTKAKLLAMLETHDRSRSPDAWFRLMVAHGMISFDEQQERWLNRCQRL